MVAMAVTGLLGVLFLGGAVLLAGGGVNTIQLLRIRRLARHGRLRSGAVVLEGTVDDAGSAPPITSPLTGQPAICYEFEVRAAGRGPDHAGQTELATGRDAVPFALATTAGTVHVDPAGADLALAPVLDVTVDGDDPEPLLSGCASATVDESTTTLRVGDVEVPADGRYRVIERRLSVGDSTTVTGPATTNRDEDTATVGPHTTPGLVEHLVGIPFVIGEYGPDRATRQLVDRAVVGLVFGLPPLFLSLVLLFPP